MPKITQFVLAASLLAVGALLGALAVVAFQSQANSKPQTVNTNQATGDEATRECLRQSLLVLADSLETQAHGYQDASSARMVECLGKTADLLESQAKASRQAAQDLRDTSEALRVAAEVFQELLHQTNIDLEFLGTIHTSLTTFNEGSKALEETLKMPQLTAIRQGLRSFDQALTTASGDIEFLAAVSYPRFYWDGKWPAFEWTPVMPNGSEVAQQMRSAAEGVLAADKELETLEKQLPQVRESIASSRKILEQVRQVTGTIYEKRHDIDHTRERLATLVSFVAESMAEVSDNVALAFQQSERLEELAQELRTLQAALTASQEKAQRSSERLRQASMQLRQQAARLSPEPVTHPQESR